MARVVIYLTSYCPYCTAAKALLRSKGVVFEEIDVTNGTWISPANSIVCLEGKPIEP